jgi:excinuclease UvrABC ATPase subunit
MTSWRAKASPTGQFFSGKRSIETPARRRKGNGKTLTCAARARTI